MLRDTRGLEDQPLTRTHFHGGVLAGFPCELLKNGSRADVNRETAEMEIAFPPCVKTKCILNAAALPVVASFSLAVIPMLWCGNLMVAATAARRSRMRRASA
jgi:hypothetical protein